MESEWNHNGCTSEVGVPTTLTLKNVPDELYERLKASADANRRSLNREAIVCLELALVPRAVAPEERLARLRALRDRLPQGALTDRQINAFKRAGRP